MKYKEIYNYYIKSLYYETQMTQISRFK